MLLVLLAKFLLYILSVPLLVFGVIISARQKCLSDYFRRLAITLDILGNVLGGPVWNKIFLKEANVIVFGSRHDTMSFVFGMNTNNLTGFGKLITKLLETIDPGHLKDAVLNP